MLSPPQREPHGLDPPPSLTEPAQTAQKPAVQGTCHREAPAAGTTGVPRVTRRRRVGGAGRCPRVKPSLATRNSAGAPSRKKLTSTTEGTWTCSERWFAARSCSSPEPVTLDPKLRKKIHSTMTFWCRDTLATHATLHQLATIPNLFPANTMGGAGVLGSLLGPWVLLMLGRQVRYEKEREREEPEREFAHVHGHGTA